MNREAGTSDQSLKREAIKHLLKLAGQSMKNAYVPYSNYRVGAALLDDQGNYYSGCNIENASFGLSVCAERTAIFKAISEGVRKIKALAVISETDKLASPCGACRQVMIEFGTQALVVMGNKHGDYQVLQIEALLPEAFKGENMHQDV